MDLRVSAVGGDQEAAGGGAPDAFRHSSTQARANLTGNARDLWITGTGTMARAGDRSRRAREARRRRGAPELGAAIQAARAATSEFVAWLERQAPSKTGPSGIGKENYNWSLRNVQLVPMTWDDEVAILKRELARSHAALKLEEAPQPGPARS